MLTDASTVILIRDPQGKNNQFEIFLMKRNPEGYMGGICVFPGGRLEEEDKSEELFLFTRGLDKKNALNYLGEDEISGNEAAGLYIAAIRETFEEAGVLFAYNQDGKLLDFSDNVVLYKFNDYRKKLLDGGINLTDIAEKENIYLALDLLIPYTRWVTPRIFPKRFNARFFLARVPESQIANHDGVEMTDSFWTTPINALEKYNAGNIYFVLPTLKTIETLNAFKTSAELFMTREASNKNKVTNK